MNLNDGPETIGKSKDDVLVGDVEEVGLVGCDPFVGLESTAR